MLVNKLVGVKGITAGTFGDSGIILPDLLQRLVGYLLIPSGDMGALTVPVLRLLRRFIEIENRREGVLTTAVTWQSWSKYAEVGV